MVGQVMVVLVRVGVGVGSWVGVGVSIVIVRLWMRVVVPFSAVTDMTQLAPLPLTT